MERYGLDYMLGEFGKHVIETEKMREEMRKRFREEYPSQDLPEHMADEFSLPRALSTFVMEIVELRAEIDRLKNG